MDTLIPSSADLAGDPAVISRAEAMRPIVEAASDEIEEKRRLPPALLDKLHEARLFRLLMPRSANGIETDPDHLLPCDRGDRQGRCLDRLVPEPGRRLRHVGGLSRPCRWRRRSSATIRAPCWPGARARGSGRSNARAATGSPACGPSPRAAGTPPGSAPTARSTGPTARRGSDANGKPVERTMLVPSSEVAVDRHLERRRPARHGERPVRAHRPFRALPTTP